MAVRVAGKMLALASLVATGPLHADLCLTDQYPHPCSSAETCATAVTEDALDVNARLALCQVHVNADELTEAAIVLQRGIDVCGKRSACNTLELVLSNVDELRQKQQQESSPEELALKQEALRGYCQGPIATARTIAACEELITSNDQDPALHEALGRKLLSRGQPARAIAALRRARERGGAGDDLAAALADAERQRQTLVDECLRDDSLHDCSSALLAGAPDEHQIQRKRGELLARADRPQQALRAFLTALSIRPNDTGTARAIVDLDPRRFTTDRLELVRARATAFRVLGNDRAEAAALQDLLAARPNEGALQRRLAELQASDEPQLAADPAQEPGLAGAVQDEPLPDPVAAPSTPPAQRAETATATIETAATAPPDTPSEAPVEVAFAPAQPEQRPPAHTTFANAVMADGRTH